MEVPSVPLRMTWPPLGAAAAAATAANHPWCSIRQVRGALLSTVLFLPSQPWQPRGRGSSAWLLFLNCCLALKGDSRQRRPKSPLFPEGLPAPNQSGASQSSCPNPRVSIPLAMMGQVGKRQQGTPYFLWNRSYTLHS